MNSYFPHDSNARFSKKLMRLRQKMGAEGYGIYFMLIERLRDEQDMKCITDYDLLEFDLRAEPDKIRSVVEDFGLFVISDDGKMFWSDGLDERMEFKEAKSRKKSDAGKKGAGNRWNDANKKAAQNGTEWQNDSRDIANGMANAWQDDSKDVAGAIADDMANAWQDDGIKENKIKENKIKSFSSDVSFSEEEKENCILAEFFFRNYRNICLEVRKFIAFNRLGGRDYNSMDRERLHAALELWEQQPPQEPRVDADFLSFWRRIYNVMMAEPPEWSIIRFFLSEMIVWKKEQRDLILYTPRCVREVIEKDLDRYAPIIKDYMANTGTKKIFYRNTDGD